MYTDLFHLCPKDSYVNTRINSYPYGVVGVPTWVSQNGSKLGPCIAAGYTDVVFEPRDEFKGDLARNYFFMATRYENRIASWVELLDPYVDAVMNGTSYPCFETWFKTLLLAWNAADPVSQKEIDRNNTIYNTLQHNRNPFIDHSEYAEMIWGNSIGIMPEPTNHPAPFGRSLAGFFEKEHCPPLERIPDGKMNACQWKAPPPLLNEAPWLTIRRPAGRPARPYPRPRRDGCAAIAQ